MRAVLLAALMERLPDQRPRTEPPPGPVVIFAAKHPAIGDVTVRDERDYGIVLALLDDPTPDVEPAQLARARQLAAEYEKTLNPSEP